MDGLDDENQIELEDLITDLDRRETKFREELKNSEMFRSTTGIRPLISVKGD